MGTREPFHIVIVGGGAAGLSAAWLLARRHKVTLLEIDNRLGGHANTADVADAGAPLIDTGFIVYNEPSYPNLTRWFDAMSVSTESSDMSFAVSRDDGNFEYAGGPVLGLAAQPSVLLRPRFWRMIADLLRFYRHAPAHIPQNPNQSLGDYLMQQGYSMDFLEDHLMPFAAAIWSSSTESMLNYPAAAFIRFCANHGLLELRNRPQWRTVTGGSRSYVQAVRSTLEQHTVRTGFNIHRIDRRVQGVDVVAADGECISADHVVLATHADQALRLLSAPCNREQELLGAFNYESNVAYLHTDKRYMPRRKRAWCSWNYVESVAADHKVGVSYWMNRLQNLESAQDYFVTLNPAIAPSEEHCLKTDHYEHPVFNNATFAAQQQLWSLQGQHRTWFCGSYFGAGFHEDAVQSGLAVAEQLGGVMRPWTLENPSTRIVVTPLDAPAIDTPALAV